ncbi:MAG: hypothetical protein O2960_27935 [Verrucomicrobia bacterium]|nr:hypothetical protein [Verrucomicrobiota bacterium]
MPDRSSRFNGSTAWTTGNPGAGVIKYPIPAIPVIEQNRSQAIAWAETARRTIVPTMHLVETDHFLIFSAWNPSNDRALRNVCEEMYAKLSRQLNVMPSEPVWIGKCPIYVFWKTQDYLRFTAEVDKTSARRADVFHAAGYHSTRGLFSHIVLNGAEDFGQTRDGAIQRFYEVLVHEGTHAFMNRYVTGRTIPVWVEEGFADFMAATLVPLSDANLKYAKSARRELERGGLSKILDKKRLNYSEYGVAQSLIRFMIRSNPQAFHKFIILLKNGKNEADALRESYRASREDLLRNWAFANR